MTTTVLPATSSTTGKAWLIKADCLFEHSGQAPAPSKDFCQITVTTSQVIFRWWKISSRQAEMQRLYPGEVKECYEDYLHDDRTQNQMSSQKPTDVHKFLIQRTPRPLAMISCAFGQPMVDYITNLCQGHIDYLQRLPDKVLQRIICYLDLDDIARVSMLNKRFHQLVSDDALWELLFRGTGTVTDELKTLAKEQGWKKLFFTNKLQIQMQLQRKRRNEVKVAAQPMKEVSRKKGHTYHDQVLAHH